MLGLALQDRNLNNNDDKLEDLRNKDEENKEVTNVLPLNADKEQEEYENLRGILQVNALINQCLSNARNSTHYLENRIKRITFVVFNAPLKLVEDNKPKLSQVKKKLQNLQDIDPNSLCN